MTLLKPEDAQGEDPTVLVAVAQSCERIIKLGRNTETRSLLISSIYYVVVAVFTSSRRNSCATCEDNIREYAFIQSGVKAAQNSLD